MSWQEGWDVDLEALLCPACDRRYLAPAGNEPALCPLCFQAEPEILEAEAALLPYTHPPELVLPFAVPEARFAEQVTAFAGTIPFAPADLTPENLQRRARRVFLPHWLVDVELQATFQVEAGFDYQVVSHRERYAGGGWQTEEVKEGRIRWEPRAGRLRRHYANVAVPALEAEAAWQEQLGSYAPEPAQPYRPAALAGAVVALPDRSPEAAWPDAVPAVRRAAHEESRLAAQADHVRDFRWSPDYGERHWTQFLRPVYATYYRDDDGLAQPVFLNGQSGQLGGSRRASGARARRLAYGLGIAAALAMLLALLLAVAGSVWDQILFTPAALALALSLLLLLGALVPPAVVWRFNRRQQAR